MSTVTKKQMEEQGHFDPGCVCFASLTNVDDICNAARKSAGKTIEGNPEEGKQIVVMAQKNLKLTVFISQYQQRHCFKPKVDTICNSTVNCWGMSEQ